MCSAIAPLLVELPFGFQASCKHFEALSQQDLTHYLPSAKSHLNLACKARKDPDWMRFCESFVKSQQSVLWQHCRALALDLIITLCQQALLLTGVRAGNILNYR